MSTVSQNNCFIEAKDAEKLQDLLVKSSRTFAVTIPMLPAPLKEMVTIAYLLFRNADSIEDEVAWPVAKRRSVLIAYGDLLESLVYQKDSEDFKNWLAAAKLRFENPNYTEVMKNLPFIIEQLLKLSDHQFKIIIKHVSQTITEMGGWLEREEKEKKLILTDLKEVEDYCYSVAGIVGEMLTELFALHSSAITGDHLFVLRHRARSFATGLQLTNIIKDYSRDLQGGRQFIPQRYLPANINEAEKIIPLITYAYQQLCDGINYVYLLPKEEIGIRQSCLLPLFLATATLKQLLINRKKLFSGEDIKIDRAKVSEMINLVEQIADDDLEIKNQWHELSKAIIQIKKIIPER